MTYEVPKKKITAAGLKNLLKLYKYIKPYQAEYGAGIFFLLLSTTASLAFPKLLGDLVSIGNSANITADLNRVALILAIILVAQASFSYFRIVLFVNVAEKTMSDLRQNTYDRLIRLPMKFFQQRRVGELNSRISADITLVQDTLTTTLAELIRQIIVVFGGIVLLFYTSHSLTLFMLAVLPVVIITATFFGKYIRKLSKKAQNQVAESNVIVEETLQGIQSVKAYTNENYEIKRYRKIVEDIAHTGIKNGKLRGAFSSFIIVGMFGAIIAVIWRGAGLMAAGEMETGKFFSFIIYTIFIAGSIGGMAGIFGQVQKFIGATEDLLEIFEEVPEEIDAPIKSDSTIKLCGAVRFDKLSFSYPSRPESEVLKNINISINPDTTTAIVGSSGAGKSTLVSLMLRLYEPSSGKLYFDENVSSSIPLTALRSQMALVPQDIFLFGGTIRENIAYGKPGASPEMIEEAAKMANAYEFISRFPEGFETLVGERGTQLSGGQRQRIAIARALLKNPRILILDEATSSLDSESERLVQDALEKLMKGRTSIVIAHRLATIRKADKILVFDGGQVVEEGTHDELISREKGIYQKLSELQFAV